jgi:hypothetical protein
MEKLTYLERLTTYQDKKNPPEKQNNNQKKPPHIAQTHDPHRATRRGAMQFCTRRSFSSVTVISNRLSKNLLVYILISLNSRLHSITFLDWHSPPSPYHSQTTRVESSRQTTDSDSCSFYRFPSCRDRAAPAPAHQAYARCHR